MRALLPLMLLAGAPLAPAPAQPVAAPAAVRFDLTTPIEAIAADPRGKAVLAKLFPGMLDHPEYADFKAMSLAEVQPLSGGLMTDAAMKQAQAELAAIR